MCVWSMVKTRMASSLQFSHQARPALSSTVCVKTIMEWKGSLELYTMLLFMVCAAVVSVMWLRRRSTILPPAPPALPIIGHLHLLGERPHQSLCKLSNIYGPLMWLRLGGVRAIVASSPDMAKQILQTHDLAFASRPRTAAGIYVTFDCSDIALAPYGPYWKLMRQLCVSDLFTTKRLQVFRPIRVEEVRELLQSMLEMGAGGHKSLELRPRLLAASNNINCRMVMGKRIDEVSSNAGTQQDFVGLVNEVLYQTGKFYVGDYIPFLGWLDVNGCVKRMKATGQRVKLLLQEVIDTRREARRGDESSPKLDLLDVLLSASKDNLLISDNNIIGVILDLFVGGADTSAITVEWALAELMKNSMAMKKVQEELDNVVGKDRLVEEADIPNLPYLVAVVKETMRLHPAVPLLIPHESTQPCQIAGYTIPAKTRAYVNVWAIGRDPTLWESPLHFLPERFINSSVDLGGQHFQLLPFGSGRRGCPGWALGLLSVHLMLATLLQGFTWSIPSSSHIDMCERFGLTVSMEKALHALVTPRLPLHLYH